MMTFETWKETTKEKPQSLCSDTTAHHWTYMVGNGSMPREAASKDPSICDTGWCRFTRWHGFTCTICEAVPSHLANLIAADVCLFSIIHKAFFDPFLVGMSTFTKAYSGFYRHFYRHTWKLPHKGHKLKYYECYKSAQHPPTLPNNSPGEY